MKRMECPYRFCGFVLFPSSMVLPPRALVPCSWCGSIRIRTELVGTIAQLSSSHLEWIACVTLQRYTWRQRKSKTCVYYCSCLVQTVLFVVVVGKYRARYLPACFMITRFGSVQSKGRQNGFSITGLKQTKHKNVFKCRYLLFIDYCFTFVSKLISI